MVYILKSDSWMGSTKIGGDKKLQRGIQFNVFLVPKITNKMSSQRGTVVRAGEFSQLSPCVLITRNLSKAIVSGIMHIYDGTTLPKCQVFHVGHLSGDKKTKSVSEFSEATLTNASIISLSFSCKYTSKGVDYYSKFQMSCSDFQLTARDTNYEHTTAGKYIFTQSSRTGVGENK